MYGCHLGGQEKEKPVYLTKICVVYKTFNKYKLRLKSIRNYKDFTLRSDLLSKLKIPSTNKKTVQTVYVNGE